MTSILPLAVLGLVGCSFGYPLLANRLHRIGRAQGLDAELWPTARAATEVP